MQGGLVTRKLPVRLSVCQTRGLWQNRKKSSAPIFIPQERPFILDFWEEEWLLGQPLLPEILGQTDPVGAKTPIFKRYSLLAHQP